MSENPASTHSARSHSNTLARLIIALYFFSGVAGLAYQVLWARMLSLQFGVSIFGVVITAAAFMVGLGFGSLWGSKKSYQIAHPLRVFALLELGVAIYAVCLPFVVMLLDSSISVLSPENLTVWYGLQLFAALMLIALPATALGVGFPMVLRSLEGSSVSLSFIYGVNTCGGAVGALLPLILLPLLGWSAAVYVVALLGVCIALVAWCLSARMSVFQRIAPVNAQAAKSISAVTMLAYGAVGATALMLEIGWTRLFGMLLLRTEYVMAVILAVFLIGIGAGSLVAARMRATWWMAVLPVVAALFALLSLWGVPILAAWAERTAFQSLVAAVFAQGFAIALLTLPVTLVLGAWLPLLARMFGNDKAAGARLYGINSVGAALGALVAGFVFIPCLGTTGSIVLASVLLFVSGMAWADKRAWFALPLLVAVAWPVYEMPPVSLLLPGSQKNSVDLMVHEDALAITQVVARRDGQRLLLADLQRMDASSEPAAVVSQQNQVRLPLMLHRDPQSVLFLGLGTGISASASLAWPDIERTAVELSQGAIDAVDDWYRPVNGGVADQMTIVRDDARRFLRTSENHYDVIIGDLFHPDFVGRSALLSVQQFARAKAALNDGGLFVQWIALNQFDPHSLQVVLRSFKKVFPDAVMYLDGFRLAMVGGNKWAPNVSATKESLSLLSENQQTLATGGEGVWSWVGRYWGPINVAPGDVQSEWAPVIEYSLPRARYRGDMDLVATMAWMLQQRIHVSVAKELLIVESEDVEAFERGYIATELALRAWIAELKGDAAAGQRLLRHAFNANAKDRWVSGAVADRMYASLEQMKNQGVDMRTSLRAIVDLRPDHAGALRDLWQLETAAGNDDVAAAYRQRFAQVSPLSSELVVR
ncbi:fused MFS/spermidine synthase [Pseudomonadota bacterium]